MNVLRLLPATLLCLPLIACGNHPSSTAANPGTAPGNAVAETSSTLGRTVKDATDKARREIAEGNIKVSADGQPRAEITPDGHLLIGGKPVAVDEAQRSQLLAYRGQVVGIAMDGMDIGVAGAKLGADAAGEALKGIFNGDSEGIEKRVNAEAAKIEAQAKRLCDRMPAMLASQQALAASLPAFTPYATMDQSDIDDCRKDSASNP